MAWLIGTVGLMLPIAAVTAGGVDLPAGSGQGDPAGFDTARWVNAWVAAWNSYDLNEVDTLFLADEHVTYLSSERQVLIRGIEALRKHHEGFGFVPGGKIQGNKLWVEDVHTEQHGPIAIVTATWFFRRGGAAGGKVQKGPMTAVYVQRNTSWRIAHMHFANY
jgi:ketosteroid isomerase-like protein